MIVPRLQHAFILLPVVLALTLVAAVAFLLSRSGGMNMSIAARGLQADSARYVAEAGLAQINTQTQGRNCSGYTDLGATAFGPHSVTATVNPKSGTPVTLTSSATTASGAAAALTRANLVVHKTVPYVITLQPGAAGMDAYIDSSEANRNDNYGAATSFIFKGPQRGLLQFDLSAIPAGAYIQSAQLGLYAENSSAHDPETLTIYPLTRAWTEGTRDGSGTADGATWRKTDGTLSWTTNGGDYDSASGVTTVLAGSGWNSLDVTPLVSNWTAASYPNYGMLLIASAGVSNGNFSSGDNATSSQWPKLTVSFLPPCGWIPPPTSVTLAASADTWINEAAANTNYGGSTTFKVQAPTNNWNRGLVRFDLGSVPAGTVLTNATLRLYVGSVGTPSASTFALHRMTDPWVEGTKTGSGSANGATWNTRDATTNWTAAPGGSFAATAEANANIGGTGWVQWNVTGLAQQWVDGLSLNYGLIVRRMNGNSAPLFNSHEAASNQPELVLTW